MLARLAGGTGPRQVTDCYKGLIDALVVDEADADEDAGIRTIVTRTLMSDADARRRLADAVLETAASAEMKIAIIGGTGTFGRALAAQLAPARRGCSTSARATHSGPRSGRSRSA